MKILVVDTETTGLPKKRNTSIYESNNWPYIVQLSYILFDINNYIIEEICDNIVKIPDNIFMPQFIINIHKISNEISHNEGKNVKIVLNKFKKCCLRADCIVGHNIVFDKNIILAEAFRNKIRNIFPRNKSFYCTMKKSINICKLPKMNIVNQYKFPKLIELFKFYFPEEIDPENLHNSMIDVLITLRCYGMLEYNIDVNEKCRLLNAVEILMNLNKL